MLLLLTSVSKPAWWDNESKTSIVVDPDAGTGARLGVNTWQAHEIASGRNWSINLRKFQPLVLNGQIFSFD